MITNKDVDKNLVEQQLKEINDKTPLSFKEEKKIRKKLMKTQKKILRHNPQYQFNKNKTKMIIAISTMIAMIILLAILCNV